VHFLLDVEVMVPDLAGWKKHRLAVPPGEHKITIVPDWVCEVFSPSTKSKDREVKMPLYAQHGVQYSWLIDPVAKTIEAFELSQGKWKSLGKFCDNDTVSIAPFTATQINLADIWTTP
jgi:Uma2 family endonuclease